MKHEKLWLYMTYLMLAAALIFSFTSFFLAYSYGYALNFGDTPYFTVLFAIMFFILSKLYKIQPCEKEPK